MLRQYDVRQSLKRTRRSLRSCQMVKRRHHWNCQRRRWCRWFLLNQRLYLQIGCLCPPLHSKLIKRIRRFIRGPLQTRCWRWNRWMGWQRHRQWQSWITIRKINRRNRIKKRWIKINWRRWQIKRSLRSLYCWPWKIRNQSCLGLISMVTRLWSRTCTPWLRRGYKKNISW